MVMKNSCFGWSNPYKKYYIFAITKLQFLLQWKYLDPFPKTFIFPTLWSNPFKTSIQKVKNNQILAYVKRVQILTLYNSNSIRNPHEKNIFLFSRLLLSKLNHGSSLDTKHFNFAQENLLEKTHSLTSHALPPG